MGTARGKNRYLYYFTQPQLVVNRQFFGMKSIFESQTQKSILLPKSMPVLSRYDDAADELRPGKCWRYEESSEEGNCSSSESSSSETLS